MPEAVLEPPVEERPAPRRRDLPGAAQEQWEAREAAQAQRWRVPLPEGVRGRRLLPLEGAQGRLGPSEAA